MASVPFVRRQRDATALGGQQALRLQSLRLASERHVHDQHLQLSRGAVASPQAITEADAQSPVPVFPHSTRTSRTVEAVIENRLAVGGAVSKSARLRTTIRDARGGIQTERSNEDRPRTTAPLHGPPPTAIRPATHTVAPMKTHAIHQKIAAVRRRCATATSAVPRKLTRSELEWIEKQLQFTQRIGLIEKECGTWWQQYYASTGTSAGADEASTTTLSIQKQLDKCDEQRRQETQEMLQQLNALRATGDDVMHMVHAMRDGTHFITDLQEAMDKFERAIGAFRIMQREKFDVYVVEEKLLERDLSAFGQRVEKWETEDAEKKICKPRERALRRTGLSRSTATRLKHVAAETLEVDLDQESTDRHESADEDVHDLERLNVNAGVDLVQRVRQLNNQIMQSGGLKGGWDDREHAVFVSTLLKCGLTDETILAHQVVQSASNQEDQASSIDFEGAVAKFLRTCIKAVVTKSENAVRSHLDWYVAHLQLVQDKKDVIQRWKQKKETERQHLIRQGLHQVDLGRENDSNVALASENGLHLGGTEATEDKGMQRKEKETRERARKNRQLETWREEKERRVAEKLKQEHEVRMEREACEAKKRQELLEKKQQVLLYKLQKEEESAIVHHHSGLNSTPSHSPQGGNDHLLQVRSRKAIEMARAKRAQLQAMEERRQKQQELPKRPKSITKRRTSGSPSEMGSPTDSEGSPSTKEDTLLKPTKAYEARRLTKLELKRKEMKRSRQGAHDSYFPGAGVVSDVKIRSFGHIAIAPRAVPTWRRNI